MLNDLALVVVEFGVNRTPAVALRSELIDGAYPQDVFSQQWMDMSEYILDELHGEGEIDMFAEDFDEDVALEDVWINENYHEYDLEYALPWLSDGALGVVSADAAEEYALTWHLALSKLKNQREEKARDQMSLFR